MNNDAYKNYVDGQRLNVWDISRYRKGEIKLVAVTVKIDTHMGRQQYYLETIRSKLLWLDDNAFVNLESAKEKALTKLNRDLARAKSIYFGYQAAREKIIYLKDES